MIGRIAILLMVVVLLGCAGQPVKRLANAEAGIAEVKSSISDFKEIQMQFAAGMVYAADLSLDRATDSPEIRLARGWLDRAQGLVGAPPASETSFLRKAVSDLLSSDSKIHKRGEKALKQTDANLEKLEKQKESLDLQLSAAEDQLRKLSRENAELAAAEAERQSQWWNPFYDLQRSLIKFLGWGAVFLFFLVLLPILGALFPAFLPIAQAIGGVIGKAIGWLIKIIPGTVEGAGLVFKGAFDVVDETKDRLVKAIEEFQTAQKNDGKVDYKELSAILSNLLGIDHKAEVNASKNKL